MQLNRALGLAALVGRFGPARSESKLYWVLHRIGVLERLPWEWDESPRLASMPWGAGQVSAPAPDSPEGLDGPWPQAPLVADDLYAPVLRIDREDQQQHRKDNILRYMGQVLSLTPFAALQALRGPRLEALDDSTFVAMIEQTSFAQFVCPELDPVDRERFAPHLRSGEGAYFKVDCSAVDPTQALPGVHVAPTVTLLRREAQGGLRALAIAIGDRVLGPDDGPAWELARYFVLQGLQYLLVLVFHPRLHFPHDAINAVTRAVLPRGHPLYRLLEPHLDLTLGLHVAVIHHRRSVLHNSQREIYAPFPVQTEGIHAGVGVGSRGIKGNSAYRPYSYGEPWMDRCFDYGRYRRDWWSTFVEFCARVTEPIAKGDPWVARWADEIAAWVPGFPNAQGILADGALARTAAAFMFGSSVAHTGDHHSYAQIPVTRLPWRLRRGPLAVGEAGPLDLDALVTTEDAFRHRLGHAMFITPAVLRSLSEMRWRFEDAAARAAVKAFQARAAEHDEEYRGGSFPCSWQIASSAQY